jgi:hypothetical protein
LGFTRNVLDDVRSQIPPDDAALKEARGRRDMTRAAAEDFDGVRRSFASGSLAHGTANCPIHERDKGLDADTGVVLDRRSYLTLGPDAEEPGRTHSDRRGHARPPPEGTAVRLPRGQVSDHEAGHPHHLLRAAARSGGPLVVGLERAGKPGLWIPNTETKAWDPRIPRAPRPADYQVRPQGAAVTRTRAIRLAKAENKRTAVPPLCSFNPDPSLARQP